jgi:hypothetical protein
MVESKIMPNETKSTEQGSETANRKRMIRGLVELGHAAAVSGGDKTICRLDPEQTSNVTTGQFDAAVKEKFKHILTTLIVAALRLTQEGNGKAASDFFDLACQSIGEQSMEELLAAEQKLNELKG